MPETGERSMKSCWMVGKRKISIRHSDYVKPERDEVVVKVKSCGICGTDLHFYNDYPTGEPIPLGHEVAGIVHETGNEVKDLNPGQSVVIQNHVPCGRCYPCLQGNYAHCTDIKTYMNDTAAMADYVCVHRSMALPFEHLSFVEAAIAEPLTVALDVMREAAVQPFQNVIISGPGIIGLFCTMLADRAGAGSITVIGHRFDTKRGKARSEAALRMGATTIIDSAKSSWKEEVTEACGGAVQRIIVTSPPATIAPLFDLASFGSWIVYNGISFREELISFNANSFHFKKLRLIASHAIPNWGFPLAFEILSGRELDFQKLVTHQFAIDRIEDAFETAASRDREVVKVVVNMD
jgi:L-iditol 2-dehydrogenase